MGGGPPRRAGSLERRPLRFLEPDVVAHRSPEVPAPAAKHANRPHGRIRNRYEYLRAAARTRTEVGSAISNAGPLLARSLLQRLWGSSTYGDGTRPPRWRAEAVRRVGPLVTVHRWISS